MDCLMNQKRPQRAFGCYEGHSCRDIKRCDYCADRRRICIGKQLYTHWNATSHFYHLTLTTLASTRVADIFKWVAHLKRREALSSVVGGVAQMEGSRKRLLHLHIILEASSEIDPATVNLQWNQLSGAIADLKRVESKEHFYNLSYYLDATADIRHDFEAVRWFKRITTNRQLFRSWGTFKDVKATRRSLSCNTIDTTRHPAPQSDERSGVEIEPTAQPVGDELELGKDSFSDTRHVRMGDSPTRSVGHNAELLETAPTPATPTASRTTQQSLELCRRDCIPPSRSNPHEQLQYQATRPAIGPFQEASRQAESKSGNDKDDVEHPHIVYGNLEADCQRIQLETCDGYELGGCHSRGDCPVS